MAPVYRQGRPLLHPTTTQNKTAKSVSCLQLLVLLFALAIVPSCGNYHYASYDEPNVPEPPHLGQVTMYEVPFFTPEECHTVAEAVAAATAVPGFVPVRSRFHPEPEIPLADLSPEV